MFKSGKLRISFAFILSIVLTIVIIPKGTQLEAAAVLTTASAKPAATHKPSAAPTKKPKPTATAKPVQKVYYKNCTAVRAAGAAPIRAGDPGYSKKLDRDGDGIGCE